MRKRSIPLSVFLTVITFGIYGIVWWFKVTEEIIQELKYESIDSAPLNLLYLIISFGLYCFWWNYKISTYLSTIERRHNVEPDFWAPLMSLTFGIILHQSRINRLSVENN
ncbi:DUF4234 domain-containing protein [Treponema putidum]|uniref:DUF4234 domain-containing protein n=1 Tax=Treponema putidum TaxID=221027 RepID=UPI003D8A741D